MARRHLVAGMPSNNLDLYRFVALPARGRRRRAPVARQADPGDARGGAPRSARSRRWSGATTSSRASARASCMRRSRLHAATGASSRPGDRAGSTPSIPTSSCSRATMLSGRWTRQRRIGAADFPAGLQPGPRRGMQLALGRQQPLAGRAQPVGGDRCRRDARDRRSRRHRARRPTGSWTCGRRPARTGRIRPRSARGRRDLHARLRRLPRLPGRRPATCSRARISARSSRYANSAPIPPGSTPTRPSSAQYQVSELFGARPTIPPFPQDRRLRQPAARRALAARRPTCTTARCRRSPTCCGRRTSGPRPSSAASTCSTSAGAASSRRPATRRSR